LSITTAPASAAAGANCLERPPPAEKKAMSVFSNERPVSSSTGSSSPRNAIRLPAERADASSRSDASGKGRFSKSCKNSVPTAPVAPAIAT
jgi:hypothetical protein